MRRREFIGLLGGAALAWPLAARAQRREKIPRIGVLWHAGSAKEEDIYLSVLRKAFSGLGYVEGRRAHYRSRVVHSLVEIRQLAQAARKTGTPLTKQNNPRSTSHMD